MATISFNRVNSVVICSGNWTRKGSVRVAIATVDDDLVVTITEEGERPIIFPLDLDKSRFALKEGDPRLIDSQGQYRVYFKGEVVKAAKPKK